MKDKFKKFVRQHWIFIWTLLSVVYVAIVQLLFSLKTSNQFFVAHWGIVFKTWREARDMCVKMTEYARMERRKWVIIRTIEIIFLISWTSVLYWSSSQKKQVNSPLLPPQWRRNHRQCCRCQVVRVLSPDYATSIDIFLCPTYNFL